MKKLLLFVVLLTCLKDVFGQESNYEGWELDTKLSTKKFETTDVNHYYKKRYFNNSEKTSRLVEYRVINFSPDSSTSGSPILITYFYLEKSSQDTIAQFGATVVVLKNGTWHPFSGPVSGSPPTSKTADLPNYLEASVKSVLSFNPDATSEEKDIMKNKTLRKTMRLNNFSTIEHQMLISLSYAPSFAFRIANYGIAQPTDLTALNTRDNADYSTFGCVTELRVGYLHHLIHGIYGSFSFTQQGFTSDSINWSNGFSFEHKTGGHNTYRFQRMGIGLGYRYSPYQHIANPVFDIGARILLPWFGITDGERVTGSHKPALDGIHKDQIMLHIGYGVNIRAGYRSQFFIIPTLYYNTTPIHRAEITTRLYSTGLNIGWQLSLFGRK